MMDIAEFKKEVRRWAEKVGVSPKEIHVRRMRRKWASCSSKGRLTFSYDLLSQPEDFRTYVIVHELLHLRYPNHGKMFRALMKVYTKLP
ncbi:M48 family metallopeptidase [Thermosulfurimonas sp. F29]|uniref:M48 metallopeptidase family protein n=1 Tax=Thermosulfurimonas sp. F29 TaxID=2867247 RepID=UPI001C82AE00|nr:M48 family metallopeptidase [Thermosulfurimonas sp. F29]MBX6424090.1 M48 family metallopeptidase [Thermosulfurimonas sp. F29]